MRNWEVEEERIEERTIVVDDDLKTRFEEQRTSSTLQEDLPEVIISFSIKAKKERLLNSTALRTNYYCFLWKPVRGEMRIIRI